MGSTKGGETRDLRLPEIFKDQDIEWQIVSWLNDSARFVVNGHQRSVAADLFSSTVNKSGLFLPLAPHRVNCVGRLMPVLRRPTDL